MKAIYSIIILIAACLVGYTSNAQTDTLKTATITVKGITCNGDMPVIKKKLLNQEGIDEAEYSEAKSGAVVFTVKYHSAVTGEEAIRKTIEAAPSCDRPKEFPYKVKQFSSANQ